jgi:hypothetical protein
VIGKTRSKVHEIILIAVNGFTLYVKMLSTQFYQHSQNGYYIFEQIIFRSFVANIYITQQNTGNEQ